MRGKTCVFGLVQLHPEERLLTDNSRPAKLRCHPLDILVTLVEVAGATVSDAAIRSRTCPATIVDESLLWVRISALRDGLGGNHFIVNVPGQGYRFVVTTAWSDEAGVAGTSVDDASKTALRNLTRTLPLRADRPEHPCRRRQPLCHRNAVFRQARPFGSQRPGTRQGPTKSRPARHVVANPNPDSQRHLGESK
jgi:DNA-binding winged helix-turn-helix (wHTH) protein